MNREKQPYTVLLDILDALDADSLSYEVSSKGRPRSLMITVSVPGRHWEIEVFEDGSIETEIFKTEGEILDGLAHVQRLFAEERSWDEPKDE